MAEYECIMVSNIPLFISVLFQSIPSTHLIPHQQLQHYLKPNQVNSLFLSDTLSWTPLNNDVYYQ